MNVNNDHSIHVLVLTKTSKISVLKSVLLPNGARRIITVLTGSVCAERIKTKVGWTLVSQHGFHKQVAYLRIVVLKELRKYITLAYYALGKLIREASVVAQYSVLKLFYISCPQHVHHSDVLPAECNVKETQLANIIFNLDINFSSSHCVVYNEVFF
jgi:hypothetical protein